MNVAIPHRRGGYVETKATRMSVTLVDDLRAHRDASALEVARDRIPAVHEAARVMAAADPDEILVSETTRALLLTNDLGFADRGEHHLEGSEGPRRLYAYVEATPPA